MLFEGEYSGVLRPMVHYIPLKKDFSNFDQVVGLIGDPGVRAEIVENAHRDLIRSGRYSYEQFVAGVDDDLATAGFTPASPTRAQRAELDHALGWGQLWRRTLSEARYLSVVPRLIIARRIPWKWVHELLRIPDEALLDSGERRRLKTLAPRLRIR